MIELDGVVVCMLMDMICYEFLGGVIGVVLVGGWVWEWLL